jgi:hypothetical protein
MLGWLSGGWAIRDERIQRNERPAYVQRDLSLPNYGINLTNPTRTRECVPEGGPEMVALKMAVDGTLIVLNVPP